MAGKLSGNAIEAGTISTEKLDANLNSAIGVLKVSSIVYPSGSSVGLSGNDIVQLVGSGFNANAKVFINYNLVSNITVTNSSSISVTTPPQDQGIYLLQVTNPDGASITVTPGIEYAEVGFQGSTSGYISGGGLAPGAKENIIDKFPFASDASASDVGDLTLARRDVAGQSSTVSGYSSGGSRNPPSPNLRVNVIDKFPFATNSNATDVGDLTQIRTSAAGQSYVPTSGYTSGGNDISLPVVNTVDKFPFATNANATDVGDLTQTRDSLTGQSSSTHGYASGGNVSFPTISNVIDKFPFASDANATDVGDLTQARRETPAGQSSTTSGYTSGGYGTPPPGVVNTIDKFPFASDASATDVGDLSFFRGGVSGQSSTASGYSSGGVGNPPLAVGITNTIDKFPFASDGNASDVGDLTVARISSAGQQV
jgi:hypothetical protein